MSQQRPNDKIRVELDLTEFDITAAEKEATYGVQADVISKKAGVNPQNLHLFLHLLREKICHEVPRYAGL